MSIRTLRRGAAPAAIVLSLGFLLAACGGSDSSNSGLTGEIAIDGSSTVLPLTSVAKELFNEQNPDVDIAVGKSGTGGGFEKFCKGETDINDASRPIKDEEAALCKDAGITPVEMVVANDAITLVVNNENTWAKCLTTEQLKKIWAPNSKINNWNQVDPSFPDVELELAGPGTDSGTFDFFTKAINGEEGASRTDYQASEDDNVVVQAVEGSKGALGYFGYTYYEENASKLKSVEVNEGDGCVAPSAETVQDGTYAPLGRPVFIYPSKQKVASNAALLPFLTYYVDNIDEIAKTAQFIPLNDKQKSTLQDELASLS